MKVIMDELFDIELPKWPGLIVVGEPVTEKQAREIIVRTDMCWMNYGPFGKAFGMEIKDFNTAYEMKKRVGGLDIDYLYNDRVSTDYIGGLHGWCDWDGRIGSNDCNVGKWPSVKEVFCEWRIIAEAFPFLELKSQLFSGEYCEDNVYPLIEFNIKNGEVFLLKPTESLFYFKKDIPMNLYPKSDWYKFQVALDEVRKELGV